MLKLPAAVLDRIVHFCYLYRSCQLSFQLSVVSCQFKATATAPGIKERVSVVAGVRGRSRKVDDHYRPAMEDGLE